MQSREYNKFFEGGLPLMAFMEEIEILNMKNAKIEDARNIIKQNEKPIPSGLHAKIISYIDRRRKAGCSEKAIKKAVKNKFCIEVF